MDPQDDVTAALTLPRRVPPDGLSVRVFADGADLEGIRDLLSNPLIQGLTTNPTLMRKAGVRDYEAFARALLDAVPHLPISFEVFADEPVEMERQGRLIAAWGENVYVKIPITDTRGEPMGDVLRSLSCTGVKVSVTGLMTLEQVARVSEALSGPTPACVSVFAGRIADTGIDPVPLMSAALDILRPHPNIELIWASPREILNVIQADEIGCHIITVTHDLLKKLELLGHDLEAFSLETVRMFHRDAVAAGYAL
ncbi:MAG: transaldolase [Solirubrobacteraceae bacterium]